MPKYFNDCFCSLNFKAIQAQKFHFSTKWQRSRYFFKAVLSYKNASKFSLERIFLLFLAGAAARCLEVVIKRQIRILICRLHPVSRSLVDCSACRSGEALVADLTHKLGFVPRVLLILVFLFLDGRVELVITKVTLKTEVGRIHMEVQVGEAAQPAALHSCFFFALFLPLELNDPESFAAERAGIVSHVISQMFFIQTPVDGHL